MIEEVPHTVCPEPECYFTPIEWSKERRHIEITTNHIIDWLKERGVGGKPLASTIVETGWIGGPNQWTQ